MAILLAKNGIDVHLPQNDAYSRFETAERARLRELPWYSKCFHWRGISKSHDQFFKQIQEQVKTNIGWQGSDSHFDKLWAHALSTHHVQWDGGDVLTVDLFQRIQSAVQQTLKYEGPGFDPTQNRPRNRMANTLFAHFSKMFRGGAMLALAMTPGGFLNPLIGFAIEEGGFREHILYMAGRGDFSYQLLMMHPSLLKAAREQLKKMLEETSAQLPIVGTPEEEIFQGFVNNVISRLPYFYPEKGEKLTIPQKVNGEWKVYEYTVDEVISMTPASFSSPLLAYGLTAEEAPPILAFCGTTAPSKSGFLASVLSDFTPGHSPGYIPFYFGKEKLLAWLEGKEKARLFGHSLGGGTAFHVAKNLSDRIEEVNAFNPPGLYSWEWPTHCGHDAVRWNIHIQENDLVPMLGSFPQGDNVNIYRVLAEKCENPLKAHSRIFLGGKQTMILKVSPEQENGRWDRKILTLLHASLSSLVFAVLLTAYLGYSLTKPARSRDAGVVVAPVEPPPPAEIQPVASEPFKLIPIG